MQNYNDTTVEVRRRKEVPYFQVDNVIIDYNIFENIYEKMAYVALCRLASQKDHAFPSNKTLAKICYCGETKIKEVLKSLEMKGFIEIQRDRFDGRGGQLSNLIYINDIPENMLTDENYFYQKKNTGGRVATTGGSCGDTRGGRVATTGGSCGDTEKEINKKNNNKKNNIKNNNKEPNLTLVQNNSSNQENEKDVVVDVLDQLGLKVPQKTLKKWRSLEKDELVIQAIEQAVKKDDVGNKIGYITRMLENGFTPSTPTQQKEKQFTKSVSRGKKDILPQWVVNQTEDSKKTNVESNKTGELTEEQKREAEELLRALGELG